MTESKYIAGAGGGGGGGKGGGGGGHTPTEADDSLQSKQFANMGVIMVAPFTLCILVLKQH